MWIHDSSETVEKQTTCLRTLILDDDYKNKLDSLDDK